MSHLKHNHPNCLNCHLPLAEFNKFCPNCGQKPLSPKSSMHDLLHEFFHTFWHLDGKFFMTLHHLLIPGKLTIEFFRGHLKRYAHPIQLFLVIGAFAFGLLASKAHDSEEKAAKKVERKRDDYKRKAFLKELDSVRQTLIPPQYSDAQTRLLSDSLMYKMIYNKGEQDGVSRDKIETEVNDALNAAFDKRHRGEIQKIGGSVGEDKTKVNYSITNESDSLHEVRQEFKDSIIDALVAISGEEKENRISKKTDILDSNRAKNRGFGEVVEAVKKKEEIREEENEIQKLLEKLRPKIDGIKQKRGLKEAIIMHEDTNNISIMGKPLHIPSHEMYELTPDEIIEKHGVKDFWLKLFVKRGIKATQDAGNLIHFYMSKLFWATVSMIPVLALFMLLVYRRSKRYYVEHIVFLIHFNTAAFLVLIPVLWVIELHGYIGNAYILWFMVHFVASLKYYYQQSWGKTLLKSIIIGLAYFFIGTLFIALGAILGLIFF